MADNDSFFIFSGTSHLELAKKIAHLLDKDLGKISIEKFPDKEINVEIQEEVFGKDVFVVQSIFLHPHDLLIELFLIIDALKRSGAHNVHVVMPYFAYARHDRKSGRSIPIAAKLIANLLQKTGISRLISMDLHSEQIQGFFDIPVDNLTASFLLCEEIKQQHIEDLIVVSPDLGSHKLAKRYAKYLQVPLALLDKERSGASQVDVVAFLGDVAQKNVLIVDDICASGATLEQAFFACQKGRSKKIFGAISHYLENSIQREIAHFEKIFTTNSTVHSKKTPNLEVICTAPIFAKAIECVLNTKSISSLYC